jgi:enolase-phosphatase E1
MAITHLLLDIEGTTCTVSFVADVLFPYARQRLGPYLADHAGEDDIALLVRDVWTVWSDDQHPEARALLEQVHAEPADRTPAEAAAAVVPYLSWLIDHDIKVTALKDLQGRIWRDGYSSGAIVAPLFADVPQALKDWHQQGLVLAVYSSGSVPAQQLLYGHSQAGDLRSLFSHWFDTRTGAKQEPASYTAIAASMGCDPAQVLFISDALTELEAADRAGLAVIFSDRPGNPGRDSGSFERINDYNQLRVNNSAAKS